VPQPSGGEYYPSYFTNQFNFLIKKHDTILFILNVMHFMSKAHKVAGTWLSLQPPKATHIFRIWENN
jgi:hypothetical protein